MSVQFKDSKKQIEENSHLIETVMKPYDLPLRAIIPILTEDINRMLFKNMQNEVGEMAESGKLAGDYTSEKFTEEEFVAQMELFSKAIYPDNKHVEIIAVFKDNSGIVKTIGLTSLLIENGL